MTILRYKDLIKLNVEEVEKRLIEVRKELMKLKAQAARGTPPENPGKIRALKRAAAKILTYKTIKQKEASKKQ